MTRRLKGPLIRRLTKKEKALAELLDRSPDKAGNVNYVCHKLRTTPKTLVNVIIPGLLEKLQEAAEKEAQAGVSQVYRPSLNEQRAAALLTGGAFSVK